MSEMPDIRAAIVRQAQHRKERQAMTQESKITADQKQAIDRLLQVAARGTGQSKRVADFLLAWWNAEECGGFDFTDMWPVDQDIRGDMLAVISFIASNHGIYPDTLGYKEHFRNLILDWRPALIERK
jgi:hypothetical protein